MTNYNLKNFLGTTFGIRTDFIQIEPFLNIIDCTVEDQNVFLNYSNTRVNPKPFNEIHETLSDLVKTKIEFSDYKIYCRDIDSNIHNEIEMIERKDNYVILGLVREYPEMKKEPKNEWYYSKNSHVLFFKNDTYSIVIDKEKMGREFLGFSVFVRRIDEDNSENKLSYFATEEALLSRFDFEPYKSVTPNYSLLKMI